MFYELKDAKTGEILESNMQGGNEISFITGRGHIIEKLEEEVLKLETGDIKTIVIPAAQACGEYDNNAIQMLPKEQFAGIELKEGMELFGQGEGGDSVRVVVKSIGDDDVTVDFNHPYAGKDLEFKVQIFDRRDATPDEIATGMVGGAHSCGCSSGGGHGHGHGGGGCCGGGGHGHGGGGCGCSHGHDDEDDHHHHHGGGGCCGGHHH